VPSVIPEYEERETTMQTRDSALKGHVAGAIDEFLAKLIQTVARAARCDSTPEQQAVGEVMNGLLRPLAKEFSQLAQDWKNGQLMQIAEEVGVYLMELSCNLGERIQQIEARRHSPNGRQTAPRPSSNGRKPVR
jgi:hypothetical protein